MLGLGDLSQLGRLLNALGLMVGIAWVFATISVLYIPAGVMASTSQSINMGSRLSISAVILLSWLGLTWTTLYAHGFTVSVLSGTVMVMLLGTLGSIGLFCVILGLVRLFWYYIISEKTASH